MAVSSPTITSVGTTDLVHPDENFLRAIEEEAKRSPSLYLDEIYEKAERNYRRGGGRAAIPCFTAIYRIIKEIRTEVRCTSAAKSRAARPVVAADTVKTAAAAEAGIGGVSARREERRTPFKKRQVARSSCIEELVSSRNCKRFRAPDAGTLTQRKKTRRQQENSPPVAKPQDRISPVVGSGSVTIWRPWESP